MNSTIQLSNKATLYKFGNPNGIIISGVHGEERAGPMAIQRLLSTEPELFENVWILPVLNIDGYNKQYRYNNYKFNLNSEFKPDTKLKFISEFMDIMKSINPSLFIDLHEDCESRSDYIWTHSDNGEKIESLVRDFCKDTKTGLIYWPTIDFYKYSSESFARSLGIKNCYTLETTLNKPLEDRVTKHIKYIKFFLDLAKK